MPSLAPRILRGLEQAIREEAEDSVPTEMRPFLDINIQSTNRMISFAVSFNFSWGRGGHTLFAGVTRGHRLEVHAWGILEAPRIYNMTAVRVFLHDVITDRMVSIERDFQLSRHLVGLPARANGSEGVDLLLSLSTDEEFAQVAAAVRRILLKNQRKPATKKVKPLPPPRKAKTLWERL